jgi:hypothetical protein
MIVCIKFRKENTNNIKDINVLGIHYEILHQCMLLWFKCTIKGI